MFSINSYHYKANGLKMVVYARDLATAERIIYHENQCSFFYWRPCIFGFIKKIKTSIPPYELEQMQLDEAIRKLNYRRSNSNLDK